MRNCFEGDLSLKCVRRDEGIAVVVTVDVLDFSGSGCISHGAFTVFYIYFDFVTDSAGCDHLCDGCSAGVKLVHSLQPLEIKERLAKLLLPYTIVLLLFLLLIVILSLSKAGLL